VGNFQLALTSDRPRGIHAVPAAGGPAARRFGPCVNRVRGQAPQFDAVALAAELPGSTLLPTPATAWQ
jgi:hypothetical protein